MRLVLTALIFLAGMFDLFMAVSFLTSPQQTAAGFALAPLGVAGLSTLRADFTAFFGVGAFCMMWGAWRRNADLLLVPTLLFGTALAARIVNVAMVGPYDGWVVPVGVEAIHVVLLLFGWRNLPHHRIAEIAA